MELVFIIKLAVHTELHAFDNNTINNPLII